MEFVRINNRNNFLLEEVPIINPHSRRYIKFWREQKKRCVQGFWSIDDENVKVDIIDINPAFPEKSDSWRYIPPSTYFYVNFGTITIRKKGTSSGAKVLGRPNLDDVEWEFGYNWIEARGFSGFEFDDRYSCNLSLLDPNLTDEDLLYKCRDNNGNTIDLLKSNYFKKDGTRKQYIPVRQYIRKLFNKNMGRPIYGNTPQNLMLLGTRDGGKSFLVANQGIVHEFLFDGLRYYDENNPVENRTIAEIVVGASVSDKSRDLLKKVKITLDNLPGTWKKGTPEEVPSPFFKHMGGSMEPNKDWKHLYKKKIGNDWKDVEGSFIKHKIFTTENPEAAAGGRPGTIVVEEVGLVGNILSIHASNDAAQNDSGIKFGSALYIGTAGNMEKITEAEMIFNKPRAYDFLAFENDWEESENRETCWFVPSYYMARDFKDANGNTMVEKAKQFFEDRRKAKEKASSKKAIEGEMMNYPMKPSEMFLTKHSSKFPIVDIKSRLRDLTSSGNTELKHTIKGLYAINEQGTIVFQEDKKLIPIHDYPLSKEHVNLEGCVEIFEPPIRNAEGNIPSGIYVAALDPVDDDGNEDYTRSLQSTFIMNLLTDKIVAEYTGRTKFAKDYYEQVRRMLMDYNATLLYENQKKGIFTYFDQKNCLWLMEDTPKQLKDMDLQRGNFVGNTSKGVYNTDKIKYWGEQELLPNYLETAAYAREGASNIHIFKSVGALREMLRYDGKVNTDRVSSLGILMIARELKLKHKVDTTKKIKKVADDPFFKRHNNTANLVPRGYMIAK